MRRYAEAAAILPVRLRTLALSLPDEVQARAGGTAHDGADTGG